MEQDWIYGGTHCEDCGQELMGRLEQFLCVYCQRDREYQLELEDLLDLLKLKAEEKNIIWDCNVMTMSEVLKEILKSQECEFCGRDISNKKADQCGQGPCQDDVELTTLISDKEKDLIKNPSDMETPNGNL